MIADYEIGDSNVLLKYLNPNIVVISTLSVDEMDQSTAKDARLAINIFDRVSGKLLQRITHDSASLPVASVVVENFVVVSYWNSKVKILRTSLLAAILIYSKRLKGLNCLQLVSTMDLLENMISKLSNLKTL